LCFSVPVAESDGVAKSKLQKALQKELQLEKEEFKVDDTVAVCLRYESSCSSVNS
jgi:hypothetical protein